MARERVITIALILITLLIAVVGCSTASPTATSSATAEALNTADSTEAANNTATSIAASTAEMTPTLENTVAPTAVGTEGVADVTCTRLNLNEVTEEQLLNTIPNFTSSMANEFFQYRPYTSIVQFRTELGSTVDDNQIEGYEQHVYVPVDPNESDAETLMQIPGVDETIAQALIDARPYTNNDAFLEELSTYVLDTQQFGEADCYLITE